MILDYLYRLQYLLHDVCTAPLIGERISHSVLNGSEIHNIESILKANKVVIKLLKNSTRNEYSTRGGGDGVEKMSENIASLDTGLKTLIQKMKGDIDINRDINTKKVSTDIADIVDVSVTLVKSLGEQYEMTNDTSVKKLQEQITEMVTSLEDYLK